jgi:predicted MFS family arabinose efflux permease
LPEKTSVSNAPHAVESGIGAGLILLMAIAAGAGAANIYYAQPLLGVIGHDFPDFPRLVSLIPTACQIGFALGLVLLVPLGDRIDRRRLILAEVAWLAGALAMMALAPSIWTLLAASVAVGLGSTVAQQIVPFAAQLTRPEQRGRTVGMVMSGLLTGILLGRVLAGAIGEHGGWRAMFWLGCAMAGIIFVLLACFLPRSIPTSRASYPELLTSLGRLIATRPSLRRATAIQAGLFGCFSAFWSMLALHLQDAPFHLGSAAAGSFGLVGVVGVLAAPLAGRISDRSGPQGVIGVSIVAVLLSFGIFAFFPSLAGLVVGIVLMDLGVQAALISNQTVIYALDPGARNRLNTVFMTGMFIGGAAGSAIGSLAWHEAGWLAVCVVGAAMALFSLTVHGAGRWGSRRPAAPACYAQEGD